MLPPIYSDSLYMGYLKRGLLKGLCAKILSGGLQYLRFSASRLYGFRVCLD